MGEGDRIVVVCSSSSSVNSRSGSGWRAKNRLQSRGLPTNDGPTIANIEHLPLADSIVESEKVLITKARGCQFCRIFRQGYSVRMSIQRDWPIPFSLHSHFVIDGTC